MDINELAKIITVELDSNDFMVQAVFDRHIAEIENLKKKGYTYKSILNRIEYPLKESHFRNILYRAKKKSNKKSESTDEVHEKLPVLKKTTEITNWFQVGVNNKDLIIRLEKHSVTPNMVKTWECANEMQVSKRFAEYIIRNNKG